MLQTLAVPVGPLEYKPRAPIRVGDSPGKRWAGKLRCGIGLGGDMSFAEAIRPGLSRIEPDLQIFFSPISLGKSGIARSVRRLVRRAVPGAIENTAKSQRPALIT